MYKTKIYHNLFFIYVLNKTLPIDSETKKIGIMDPLLSWIKSF